jgi:hydrogenase maturation protein HypF
LDESSAEYSESIRVRGLVQGVGFRPTVWRIANELDLSGEVLNDGDGVLITVRGTSAAIDRLCDRLHTECPPLARIDSVTRRPGEGVVSGQGFVIAASRQTAVDTGIVADAATCDACRAEIFDPDDRRFRYPFTNCTHCGPRLSIVRGIPYDRGNTSMAGFVQCPACQREYEDPADRRFHAQPNACPVCGPRVWLVDRRGAPVDNGPHVDAIAHATRLLAGGHLLAIKGIGGFHLACDATNAGAVDRLRARKRRYAKPFALMADRVETIGRYVDVGEAERAGLTSPAAPIVLMERRPDAPPLAPAVAPGQDQLGFMLPYSPLHHLLLADWMALGHTGPLVMTSGNLSDEPQCKDNEDAGERLADIADYRLVHDRDIVNRVDDSVIRADNGGLRFLRRARGYAPAPLPLPDGFEDAPALLALGAELKNTFCLLRRGQAVVSQHLGDLEDARTSDAWEQALALYRDLYRHEPEAIVVDRHGDYRSSRFGRELAASAGIPVMAVQHHHAHIAAALAENRHARDAGPVLGIAFDGLGMGTDGTLWGGEFLHADYATFDRLGHLPAVPLPGGTQALLEPWRNTWTQLVTQVGWEAVIARWGQLEAVRWLIDQPLDMLQAMVDRGINSPPSSAGGRLFDAVAGLLGICRERIAYEGQAAIELETLARRATAEPDGYPIDLTTPQAGLGPLWTALLDDLSAGTDTARIAARFHSGLAKAIIAAAVHWCQRHGLSHVALSGGVFQNRTLFCRVERDLRNVGLEVYSHRQLPTNDGCISFGQAMVAAARIVG